MNECEQLIENAIVICEGCGKFDTFANYRYNQEMARETGIPLEAVWCIASYVVRVCKPEWEDRAIKVARWK